MKLHEYVRQFPKDWAPRSSPYPTECEIARVRRRIDETADAKEARPVPVDLDDLKRSLIVCYDTRNWTSLSSRQWRYSSECLNMGMPQLLENEEFIGSYLTSLEASRGFPTAINQLVRWYVVNFAPVTRGFALVANFLIKHVGIVRSKWRDLHERHRLFLPEPAASLIAADFLASGGSVEEFISRSGYPAAALPSSLFAYAFIEACHMIASAPNTPTLERLTKLSHWGVIGNGLRYGNTPGTQVALAEALLLPWLRRHPDEKIRAFVVRLLIGVIGDPRTNNFAWSEINPPARTIMLRWMTKDALEQFLDVVDQTVQSHQSRMWGARRAFWLSYESARLIQETWVVFGRRGAAIARVVATEKDLPTLAHFGTFARDLGGDAAQSVLLMRIGTVLVADWSHNGRCHIWLADNPNAPELYKTDYLREELEHASDFETPHHGEWRADIQAYINARGGASAE